MEGGQTDSVFGDVELVLKGWAVRFGVGLRPRKSRGRRLWELVIVSQCVVGERGRIPLWDDEDRMTGGSEQQVDAQSDARRKKPSIFSRKGKAVAVIEVGMEEAEAGGTKVVFCLDERAQRQNAQGM